MERKLTKVLETFDGFVDKIVGEIAYITLTSEHGDVLWGEYDSVKLAEKGIKERRRFKCQTVEVKEGKWSIEADKPPIGYHVVRIDIQAIPDIELTPEREQEISEEIDRLLGD
jgi:hypothetical protein